MKRIFEKSIKRQFKFILYCLISLTLVFFILYYGYVYRLMTKSARTYAQNTANRFDAEIQYIIRRADSILVNLMFDPNVERMMLCPYSENTPQYIKSLLVQFSSYSIINEDISDIALTSPDMCWSNYYDSTSLQSFRAQMDNTYDTKCLGLQTSPLAAYKKSNEKRLVFARNMYGMHDDTSYGRYLGTIVLSLDPLKSPITLPSNDELGTYFILRSSNGITFSFNCPEKQFDEILAHWSNKNEPLGGGTFLQEIPGYHVSTTRIDGTNLYIISALDRNILTRDVNRTMVIFLLVSVAFFLLLAILMLFLSRSMVIPLQKLNDYIIRIKNIAPVMQKKPLHLDGCEEVQNLNRSFCDLLEHQAQLTQELHQTTVTLYETKLGKTQAEYNFLKSQINPHFLYNALESINAIAVEHGVIEISNAVGALGKLFRYNVKASETVPLWQELETAKAYLTVQKMRFADKLNVICSARESTLNIPVMKLLLQPLIENAVHHGIEPKNGIGTLYIGTRIEGDKLLVSIYDDGVGIPPKELEQLQQLLQNPPVSTTAPGEHVGIMNVACRIKLKYGTEYGLQIENDPEGGTRQILVLPAILNLEESKEYIDKIDESDP
jgi:two-component system, sensor histidine kinase YesM